MAKLMSMFLVLIVIQSALLIYTNQTAVDNVLWNFVMNLHQWGNLAFVLALIGIAAGIGLVGVAAASTFGFKTDFLIFAPAIAGFISLGVVLTNLASVIQGELIGSVFTTCDISNPILCGPVNLILALTVGWLGLFYTWTIIEWWRGKDY
jgi:hypothetical protein